MKKMVRRGQSGTEFLAVTGIGLVLLIGVSFFLLSDTRSSGDKATLRQVHQIGSEILAQSRVVQSQGKNSWITVEANVPESVDQIYTVENNTLVFDINTINGIVKQPVFSIVPISGLWVVGDRAYLYDSAASPIAPTGVVRFKVFSNGSTALLSTQDLP